MLDNWGSYFQQGSWEFYQLLLEWPNAEIMGHLCTCRSPRLHKIIYAFTGVFRFIYFKATTLGPHQFYLHCQIFPCRFIPVAFSIAKVYIAQKLMLIRQYILFVQSKPPVLNRQLFTNLVKGKSNKWTMYVKLMRPRCGVLKEQRSKGNVYSGFSFSIKKGFKGSPYGSNGGSLFCTGIKFNHTFQVCRHSFSLHSHSYRNRVEHEVINCATKLNSVNLM